MPFVGTTNVELNDYVFVDLVVNLDADTIDVPSVMLQQKEFAAGDDSCSSSLFESVVESNRLVAILRTNTLEIQNGNRFK